MNNKKTLTGLLALVMVFGAAATAYAHPGGSKEGVEGGQPQKAAFMQNLTESQKEAMKQAHELAKSGNEEAAKELLESAGIEGKRFMRHKGPKPLRNENVRLAVQSNDYAAFQLATEGKKISEFMTVERFGLLVQSYEARQNGDQETAHNLMKELHDKIKADKEAQNS